jgi:hypothetical protein
MDPTQSETKRVDKTESQPEAMNALSVPRLRIYNKHGLYSEEQSKVNRSPEQLKQIRIMEDMLNSFELINREKSFILRMSDSDCIWVPESVTISVTVPAGVTDIEAMRALNYYNKGKLVQISHPGLELSFICSAPSIDPDDHDWYQSLPEKYPAFCRERDYTDARRITVQLVVKGTETLDFERQAAVLTSKGLSFADPRDLAIAVGVYRSWCFRKGEGHLHWDHGSSLGYQGSVPGSVVRQGSDEEYFIDSTEPTHRPGWAAGSPLQG